MKNGTSSTGINVKNVHNIVFASSYKSKIKVIQSIGRGLRLNKIKSEVVLYDIVDDLTLNDEDYNYYNHSIRHSKDRRKLYKKEGYDNLSVINVKLT